MQSNFPATSAAGPSPAVIPTMAATAVPGQYNAINISVLGKVPCSGSTADATAYILRSTADWNAYLASTACANPSGTISLSGFNFSTQSVLILQFQACGTVATEPNIWNVYQMNGYLYARCDISSSPINPIQMGCNTVAVAVPATSQGVTWTICEQSPGYHCLTPITP